VSHLELRVEPHPLLAVGAFLTHFPAPLGKIRSRSELSALLRPDAAAPFHSDDDLRAAVRDLLRHGGYKPTGRGKPASEYLIRAASEGTLGSINLAVDACNVTSLHSGLPISVIDLERARAPFRVAIAPPGQSYVFNASGQEIDVTGLLCLFDADGPCANAVKDAQRTKTTPETVDTLSVVWAPKAYEERLHEAVGWYRQLLEQAGAQTEDVRIAR
jgi:DNA/RNA-binding domain of Phe-tRNA-synthetase-like protein